MSDQVNKPVCVATAEKSPEQLRHEAVYQWAVTDKKLKGTRDSDEHKVKNFHVKWQDRDFERCYEYLTDYMKTSDFDLNDAREWRTWINSIRSGEFTPA